MYTFEDRGGRSLTLRPEGTAPICRAYLEHGLHREPQPVKLYTIATDVPVRRPQRGRYREHWQLSVEAIGSDDPAIDAELIQLYDELLRRLGVTNYELLAQLDRRRELPARVRRAADAPGSTSTSDVLDDDARQKRATSPLRVFDVKSERVQEALARRAEDRRLALRRVPRALRRRCASTSTHYGVEYELVPDPRARARLLHAHDVRVRRTRRSARRARSAAAAATTAWSRSSAASRRPASASAPASSGCCSRSRPRASTRRAPTSSTSSSSLDEARPKPRVLPLVAELRRRGLARRRRLRGPLAEGPAHAGRRLGARGDRRRRGRRSARPCAGRGSRTRRFRLAELAERLAAMSWRDLKCGELRTEHVGRAADARRLGRHAAATTAGSSSSTCATRAASRSS